MAVTLLQFDEFELGCEGFELRRQGRAVKLEKLPMELLILLAANSGRLVTRQEIVERLWGAEVFVDTEHGINTAVRKIRQTLRDDPEQPRFVQTITGRGYRFIGTVAPSNGAPAPGASAPGASPAGIHAGTVIDGATQQVAGAALLPDSSLTTADTKPSNALPVSVDGNRARPIVQAVATLGRPSRRWLWGAVTLATFGVFALMLGIYPHPHASDAAALPPIASLAVLPLDNLSGDPGQEYFADGMTDDLITMLAKVSSLRILSRTSVMQYKGVHRPLREIARELGVDGVLEGSVARTGTRVHMTLQLIHAASDTHLWAESYDRDLTNVAALPREAAQGIAKDLNRVAAVQSSQRFVRPDAHDAYLRGRYYWFAGQYGHAADYFRKTIELQPDYAAGWSGLADDYVARAVLNIARPAEVMPPGESAALRAVELDPSLPEAHNSVAAAYLFQWKWDGALMESKRALELNPRYAEAHHLRAYALLALNRMDEALEEQKKSTELDPFQWPWALGVHYILQHNCDAALNEAHMRLDAFPNDDSLHALLAEVYWCKGRPEEAVQELEKEEVLEGHASIAAGIHRAFQQGGSRAVLEFRIGELKRSSAKEYVSPISFAYEYAHLGRKEETLQFLQKALEERSPDLLFMQHQPSFDFLHSDERYRAIVRQVGLPPAY